MITKITLSLFFMVSLLLSPQRQADSVRITSPGVGDSVQGIVEITGSVSTGAFAYAEVFFAYTSADNLNWFMINRFEQPVVSGVIARWDTTTITDGVYQLRLRVHYRDESYEDLIINPVIVRNYTLLETSTPAAVTIAATALPTRIAPNLEIVFSTPLPPNPAATSGTALKRSTITGLVLAGISMFLLLAFNFARNRLR